MDSRLQGRGSGVCDRSLFLVVHGQEQYIYTSIWGLFPRFSFQIKSFRYN